jgi:hypothetical protein
MIIQYYLDSDLKKLTRVTNPELNEILDKVRQRDDSFYIKEFTIPILSKLPFFKTVFETRYNLLKRINGSQCLIVNLKGQQGEKNAINVNCSGNELMNYLKGVSDGYDTRMVQELERPDDEPKIC